MKSVLRRIAAAAVLAGAASASAFAGTLDVRFLGTGNGRSVSIRLNGNNLGVYAGQLKHEFRNGNGNAAPLSGQIQRTFCTELTQFVTGTWKVFSLKQVREVPNNPGPMGDIKAQAIYALYAEANGAQFDAASTSAARDMASAFQLAVWEIINDFNGTAASLNVGAGAFRVTGGVNSGMQAFLTQLLNGVIERDALGSAGGVRAVSNGNHQDQLVMIPLPAPLAMGLVGLVGVYIVRRRRAAGA